MGSIRSELGRYFDSIIQCAEPLFPNVKCLLHVDENVNVKHHIKQNYNFHTC
jgi:hypothetical protein